MDNSKNILFAEYFVNELCKHCEEHNIFVENNIKIKRNNNKVSGIKYLNNSLADQAICIVRLNTLLKNERYIGIYKYKDEVFENIYPPIVPKEIFDKVRIKTKQNNLGKNSIKIDYLLRGKVKCGCCGKPVIGDSGTARNGTMLYYYKCSGRKRKSGCKKDSIHKEFLENTIVDQTIEELSKPEIMNRVVDGLLSMQDSLSRENPTLNMLTRERKEVTASLDNLVSALERGIVSKTTNKRLNDLEERQELLDKQILIEKSKMATKVSEREIKEFYRSALKRLPKHLINLLVKEVVLFDDKIEIHYNSPIQKSPDANQGFSFVYKTISSLYKLSFNPTTTRCDLIIHMIID